MLTTQPAVQTQHQQRLTGPTVALTLLSAPQEVDTLLTTLLVLLREIKYSTIPVVHTVLAMLTKDAEFAHKF